MLSHQWYVICSYTCSQEPLKQQRNYEGTEPQEEHVVNVFSNLLLDANMHS